MNKLTDTTLKLSHFFKFFISLSIIFYFSITNIFAVSKNIVYSQNFDYLQITDLDIHLIYEDLVIEQIYGDEFLVEIGCNNSKLMPTVTLDDFTLCIQNKSKKNSKGNKCTVYLYIPQDFRASNIKISSTSGDILADYLYSLDSIDIDSTSGDIKISKCFCEFLKIHTINGNHHLEKVSSEYFLINSTSGDINFELSSSICAKSYIQNTSGDIKITYPKTLNIDFSLDTVSGNIQIDSQQIKNAPFTNYEYSIGDQGASLDCKTTSGDIKLSSI